MPSLIHEVLVELFTETPALADLLRVACDIRVAQLSPAHPNFSETKPVELRGDAFFLSGDPRRPRGWLLLEVQTSIDPKKLRTIPLSLELGQARFRDIPGDVVLVTASEEVARYFDRHPFLFRGWLRSRRLLEVTRVDLSRLSSRALLDPKRPLLGLLAVATHRKGPRSPTIARRAVELLAKEQGPLSARAIDVILQMVEAKARKELVEDMLRGEYKTPFLRKAFAEGEAKGKAKGEARGEARGEAKGRVKEARAALTRVLTKRSFTLSATLRRRIEAENDIKRLERWLDAAVTARSMAEVFSDA